MQSSTNKSGLLKKIFLSIVFLYFVFQILQKYLLLSYFGEETAGKVEEVYVSRVGSVTLRYSYTVDGRNFIRGMSIGRHLQCEEEESRCVGKPVIVEFLPWNPRISRAILES